jgi:chemosensory pili system protein ChpA (sensor histidine kinase/response regulator)
MDRAERDFLLSVFLMEAWETLAILEEQGPALAEGGALDTLHLVAHRLRGSAALHGFDRVSALSGQIEDLVEVAMVQLPAERQQAALTLADLVAKLKQALDGGPVEDERAIGEPAASPSAARDLEAVDLGPAATPPSPPLDGPRTQSEAGGLEEALRRFFADGTDMLGYFLPEAAEHLEVMASSLGALARGGRDPGEIAQLFRAVHTLKGAAYTVGCQPVGDLTHRAEDLLAAVREATCEITPALLEALSATVEAVRAMLALDGNSSSVSEVVGHARAALDSVAGGLATDAVPAEARVHVPPIAATIRGTTPAPATAAGAPEPPAVTGGSIRVGLDRLDALMKLTGELVSARTRLEQHLARLEQVDDLLRFTGSRMAHVVGEFERKYLDPRLPDAPRISETARSSAGQPPADEEVFGDLEFDRYDDFNALARSVGELATDVGEIQARLGAVVRGVRQEVTHVQRLGGDLRGQVSRARMVPMSRLFARLPRQVEEVARAAGRDVDLVAQGETVEIDTSLVEQLTDPLLHLLRNAVVHGIESPDERRGLGKAPRGTIRLRASQRGGAIRLEVGDDGRGIDADAVGQEAVRRGLVAADVLPRLAPREVLDLVFLPGLSTASAPSTVAGRGVGMDVVRTNVGRLGGSIDLESQPGSGTRFTFTLPLTIAITEVLLVRVGREVMAVPATAVTSIVVADPASIESAGGEPRLKLEDGTVRLVDVAQVLELARFETSARRVALVLRSGPQGLAIAVDELLRKDEVVVKALGRFLEALPMYAGATISQEGRVVLVLDPARLTTFAARSGRAGAAAAGRTAATALDAEPPARRVLLVDDSVSVRRFVGQMLERAGLRVVTANDGADALERLRELPFDAVVTDLEMPRVDGYELIRDLRRRPGLRDVPVVVLTTRAGDKHADLARRLGVARYVTKPVDEQSFVALVDALTTAGVEGATR